MTAIPIVVVSERDQFHLQIRSSPKQQPVQTLSADCSNQSLDERMGPGSVRNCLDFRNSENTEVRLPLMKPIQRIVIGAEIFRQAGASNRLFEHPAERQAIDDSALDPESDDSACVLVHDDQHPIRLQGNRFTSKQVEAPQTVLYLTDERQPRGTAFRRRRPVMQSQNPPNDILI